MEPQLTRADVPGMLAAAWELASTLGPLAPAVLSSKDVAVIAAHIGAAVQHGGCSVSGDPSVKGK
ncbi:hypothetical protein AB0E08_07620 [Streptomyces sp. NPDC048281]|uniref:hypothetical protein n=1 Tax=Streptomyces sp. NPDC048281 TaxID=3154715 RepID=UPI003428FF13